MAELTVQTVVVGGLAPSLVAASAGGDQFVNDDRTVLLVRGKNQTDTQTVSIAKVRNVIKEGFGTVIPDAISVTVPPMTGDPQDRWIAIPPGIYNSGGRVSVSYSAVVELTVAAVRRPQD